MQKVHDLGVMSKRRKRTILLACGIFALGLTWALLARREPEPSYHGRTLSQWLDQMQQSGYWSASGEASRAIRAIGTNAIPISLKWISYERSSLRKQIATFVGRLPPAISRRFPFYPEQRAQRAAIVLSILGPEAHSAIPELTRYALSSSDDMRPTRCLYVLGHLGPEALPSLITLVTNGSPDTRFIAIFRLPAFEDAEAAVPALVQCLDDKNSRVADGAAIILGALSVDQTAVFSGLTNPLQSFSTQGRVRAVKSILSIKFPATEKVPVLLPMLTDPDFKVREATTNALRAMAPDIFTNAPPR